MELMLVLLSKDRHNETMHCLDRNRVHTHLRASGDESRLRSDIRPRLPAVPACGQEAPPPLAGHTFWSHTQAICVGSSAQSV